MRKHPLILDSVFKHTSIQDKEFSKVRSCLHGVRKILEGGSSQRHMFSVFGLYAKGCTCSQSQDLHSLQVGRSQYHVNCLCYRKILVLGTKPTKIAAGRSVANNHGNRGRPFRLALQGADFCDNSAERQLLTPVKRAEGPKLYVCFCRPSFLQSKQVKRTPQDSINELII